MPHLLRKTAAERNVIRKRILVKIFISKPAAATPAKNDIAPYNAKSPIVIFCNAIVPPQFHSDKISFRFDTIILNDR